MSFFDTITNYFSGGAQKGAEDYEESLRQGLNELKKYGLEGANFLNPYATAGEGQIGALQRAIASMINPGQYYNQIMSNYQESPAAKMQQEVGTNNALNAASASGMLGSSDLLNDINQQSQNISNQDMQQYFNNMMGINTQGLNMAQHMYDAGYGADAQKASIYNNLARAIAQMYGGIGKARMAGDEARSSGLGGIISKII